jgi:hypothetical protein
LFWRFTGKKGSCDLFSSLVLPFPNGVRQAKASSFLSSAQAEGGLYGQKHNLRKTKQKDAVIPFLREKHFLVYQRLKFC